MLPAHGTPRRSAALGARAGRRRRLRRPARSCASKLASLWFAPVIQRCRHRGGVGAIAIGSRRPTGVRSTSLREWKVVRMLYEPGAAGAPCRSLHASARKLVSTDASHLATRWQGGLRGRRDNSPRFVAKRDEAADSRPIMSASSDVVSLAVHSSLRLGAFATSDVA